MANAKYKRPKAELNRICVTIPLPKTETDNGMEKDGKAG